MALIEFGGLVVQASGQIGESVYARNRSGAYVRAIGKAVYSNTFYQALYAANMNVAVHGWQSLLTNDDRQLWESFAATRVRSNRLGNKFKATGYNTFISFALNYLKFGMSPPAQPPILNLPFRIDDFTVVTSITGASMITNATLIPNGTNTFFAIYATPPLPQSITAPNKYFRYLTFREQNSDLIVNIISDYTTRFGTPILGNNIFFRLQIYPADCRYMGMQLACVSLVGV